MPTGEFDLHDDRSGSGDGAEGGVPHPPAWYAAVALLYAVVTSALPWLINPLAIEIADAIAEFAFATAVFTSA